MSDYGDLIKSTYQSQPDDGAAIAVGEVEADPDKAMRAIELGQSFGVSPSVVYSDVEGFERTTKAKLSADLVRNNEHLSRYALSDPMAPKVSSGDWGQLDTLSQSLGKMARSEGKAFVEGFKEGFDYDGMDAEYQKLLNAVDSPMWRSFVQKSGFGGAGVALMSAERGFRGLMYGFANYVNVSAQNLGMSEADAARLRRDTVAWLEVGTSGQAGGFGRVRAGQRRAAAEVEGIKAEADAVGAEAMREHLQVAQLAEPYIRAGQEPPTGLHQAIDDVKIAQSELDLERLDESFSEAQKSATRERAPDLFAAFVRQHTDAKIGISADAVRELYGDKKPLPDDNLLGWVPKIGDQLEAAIATGSDIMVPLADWLAKADPEVAKQLHDFLRVRPGGVTKAEAVMISEARKAQKMGDEGQNVSGELEMALRDAGMERGAAAHFSVEGEDYRTGLWAIIPGNELANLDQAKLQKIMRDFKTERRNGDLWVRTREYEPVNIIRQSSALKPMFGDVQEPRLTLQKIDQNNEGFHVFQMLDAEGLNAADLVIYERPGGKEISVEEITARGDNKANSLGPAALRDILEQVKAQFPNAEELTGFRVSGAREAAGTIHTKGEVRIPLRQSAALVDDLEHFAAIIEGGDWLDYGLNTTALVRPKELFSVHERAIAAAVNEEITRIAPRELEVHVADEIRMASGQEARGLHIQYYGRVPIILWSLADEDPIGVGRHEAMHHLRKYGFFKPEEWATLERAAVENGWLEKHKIAENYGGLSHEFQLEEAIAHEFEGWRRTGKKEGGFLQPIFERLDQLLEAIRERIASIVGYEPTWQELFDLADAGDIGKRTGNEPLDAGVGRASAAKKPEQLELDVTRMAEREVFAKASAIGMTVEQYKRYMRLIDKRRAEDIAKETEKVEREERRKQTKTWKENEVAEREKAVEIVNQRPDIAADKLFRDGTLYGQRMGDAPKLGVEFLTPEQQAGLPKKWQSDRGMHPDDLAGLFGYKSGADMLDRLVALEGARRELRVRPETYNRMLIQQVTDQLMREKYGDLEENIIREAKDRVLSETQLDLLHEEMVYLAEQAGAQLPIPDLKKWIAENFQKQLVTDISSDKLLAAAGRAGKEAEMALLKGDAATAFQQKQRQYLAITMARDALTAEKQVEEFTKTAKRFEARQVAKVDQEFTDYIQELLVQVGLPVKRSIQEIQDNQARHGYGSLSDFVAAKSADGWEVAVADYIAAKQVKPLEQMTVEEFRDFKDAIDSLAHIGKEVNKLEMAGKRVEFEEFKKEVLDNIRTLPPRNKNKPMRIPFRYDAEVTRMEEIVKDLDLRKELGPLFNALIRPMAEAKHTEYSMLEDLSRKLTDIRGFAKGWQKTLSDTVPQDFFVDPYDGTLFDLTREHMIQIMLNFGNRSNIDKFTRGYVGKEEAPAFEAKLRQMFDQHATKEDWDFVQKIWDLFDEWRKGSDKLYYDLSGVTPKWIEAEPVNTPHGPYRGGYYPVIYDKLRSNIGVVEERADPNSLFGTNYFRATPGNSYTKERTGYVDRVQFQTSIEQVAQRMQQMIHDISYRRAVMDANKVIHDREIRGAIRKHYGAEYEAQLYPWLKDIANHFNSNEQAVSFANAVLRRTRWNLMGHALGLNLKVILSPDLGALNPKEVMLTLASPQASIENAHKWSREIPHTFRNMDRDFRERLEQTTAVKGWAEFQADAVRYSFYPLVKLSQGFRIMTFNREFQKMIDKGWSEGDAAAWADSKVRERHGSGGLPDLPAIMRSSEAMKVATLFYGFFNAMYNWQRQMVGNVRRGEWSQGMENLYGSVLIPAFFGAVLFNQQKEGDSWFKTISKALTLQPLSTMVFVRDFANYFVEGWPSRTPLESLFTAFGSLYSDTKKWWVGKRVEKGIQHTANVIGLSTGLPMAQIGRSGQFIYDVNTGRQRPRNIMEWMRGLIHGEAKLKK